uniref:Ribosomal protein S16 n=1 Tax=Antithamnionella ternifolia TaxID=207919 RepID=A0A4D6WJQ4_9FLOR|nr:ribosomal protein S16 [Antithamnionella ternifolia]
MLKIRLKRLGRKKRACYRVIVIDSKKRRDGKAIEEVGFYDPITKNIKLNINSIEQRIKTGAQLTPTVQHLVNKTLNNSQ